MSLLLARLTTGGTNAFGEILATAAIIVATSTASIGASGSASFGTASVSAAGSAGSVDIAAGTISAGEATVSASGLCAASITSAAEFSFISSSGEASSSTSSASSAVADSSIASSAIAIGCESSCDSSIVHAYVGSASVVETTATAYAVHVGALAAGSSSQSSLCVALLDAQPVLVSASGFIGCALTSSIESQSARFDGVLDASTTSGAIIASAAIAAAVCGQSTWATTESVSSSAIASGECTFRFRIGSVSSSGIVTNVSNGAVIVRGSIPGAATRNTANNGAISSRNTVSGAVTNKQSIDGTIR